MTALSPDGGAPQCQPVSRTHGSSLDTRSRHNPRQIRDRWVPSLRSWRYKADVVLAAVGTYKHNKVLKNRRRTLGLADDTMQQKPSYSTYDCFCQPQAGRIQWRHNQDTIWLWTHIDWLAVAFLQASHCAFYVRRRGVSAPSNHRGGMSARGSFKDKSVGEVLVEGREELVDIAVQFDEMLGLSFDTVTFSFSLAAIVSKGVRQQGLKEASLGAEDFGGGYAQVPRDDEVF
ncbi:hypothetical protein C8J56DRAFT_1070524 [Mycena floridula]|nr:hypothetical protein C8J56DRAFT_1070524 [Mycena floridula]